MGKITEKICLKKTNEEQKGTWKNTWIQIKTSTKICLKKTNKKEKIPENLISKYVWKRHTKEKDTKKSDIEICLKKAIENNT